MRILIIGCGRMGAGLAQTMSRRGHHVTVVDSAPASFQRLGPAFTGRTLVGVGFDREVLIEAGIERVDGVAAVTGSDAANVVAARLASQFFRVPKVVARLYDPRKAEIYRRLGLQTVAPTPWGVNRVAELLTYSELNVVQSLGSGEVDMVEVEIPPLLAGRSVAELTVTGEIRVAALSRGGRTFLPTRGTVFQAGDVAHLVVLATAADRLKRLLGMI